VIDNFAVYTSCIAVIYIAWRAALLDGVLPWFQSFGPRKRRDSDPEPRGEDTPVPPWRRR
jgi:hypothetical protein